jgi:hypothetical protein
MYKRLQIRDVDSTAAPAKVILDWTETSAGRANMKGVLYVCLSRSGGVESSGVNMFMGTYYVKYRAEQPTK